MKLKKQEKICAISREEIIYKGLKKAFICLLLVFFILFCFYMYILGVEKGRKTKPNVRFYPPSIERDYPDRLRKHYSGTKKIDI